MCRPSGQDGWTSFTPVFSCFNPENLRHGYFGTRRVGLERPSFHVNSSRTVYTTQKRFAVMVSPNQNSKGQVQHLSEKYWTRGAGVQVRLNHLGRGGRRSGRPRRLNTSHQGGNKTVFFFPFLFYPPGEFHPRNRSFPRRPPTNAASTRPAQSPRRQAQFIQIFRSQAGRSESRQEQGLSFRAASKIWRETRARFLYR